MFQRKTHKMIVVMCVFLCMATTGCSFIADVASDINAGASAMAENGANRNVAKQQYDHDTYQKPIR